MVSSSANPLVGLLFCGGFAVTVAVYVVVADNTWRRDGFLRVKNPFSVGPLGGDLGTIANLSGRGDKRAAHELRRPLWVYRWLAVCAVVATAFAVGAVAFMV